MDPKTTLATEVAIHTNVGVSRMRDVSVRIERGRRITLTFDMGFSGDIRVALTEAERVSLIEALGGKP